MDTESHDYGGKLFVASGSGTTTTTISATTGPSVWKTVITSMESEQRIFNLHRTLESQAASGLSKHEMARTAAHEMAKIIQMIYDERVPF